MAVMARFHSHHQLQKYTPSIKNCTSSPFAVIIIYRGCNLWQSLKKLSRRRRASDPQLFSICQRLEVSNISESMLTEFVLTDRNLACAAKKIKKDWIEKAKVKSKWRAQKRKEGITQPKDMHPPPSTSSPLRPPFHQQKLEEGDADIDEKKKRKDVNIQSGVDAFNHRSHQNTDAESLGPHANVPGRNKQKPNRKARGGKRDAMVHLENTHSEGATGSESLKYQSLRELTRVAYSRSGQHTVPQEGKQQIKATSRPCSNEVTRKRVGQPNMKLRMEVMLEHIKRGYS